MVGSIDPRCDTVRGTHWPVKVAGVFGTRVAGNHLGQRSKRPASTGRTYGCKRSDQTLKKTLAARGPSTYGSPLSRGRQNSRFEFQTANCRTVIASNIRLETVIAKSQRVPPSAGPMINSATKQSILS